MKVKEQLPPESVFCTIFQIATSFDCFDTHSASFCSNVSRNLTESFCAILNSEEIARRLQEEEDKYEDDQREAYRRSQSQNQKQGQQQQRRGRSFQDTTHPRGAVAVGGDHGHGARGGAPVPPGHPRERHHGGSREERKRDSVSDSCGAAHHGSLVQTTSELMVGDFYRPQVVAGPMRRGRSRCVCCLLGFSLVSFSVFLSFDFFPLFHV